MLSLWGIIKGLLVQEEADRTKQLSIEVDSNATTNTRTTLRASQTADRTVDLPDADDTLVGKNTTDVFTNKTLDLDAAGNSLQNVRDAEIALDADIQRTKLATGSNDHVLINSPTGEISSEAQLSPARGGTGQDLSAAEGVVQYDSGVASDKQLKVDDTGASDITTLDVNATVARTLTLPDADDTLVARNTTDSLQNKTIDATSATGTNTVSIDASDASYDNAASSLSATDAQAAIDEIDGRVDTAETDVNNLETLSGSPGAVDHGTFTGTTIPDNETTKGALQSLETAVEDRQLTSEKSQPNGYASLDGSGLVPAAELGSIDRLSDVDTSTVAPTQDQVLQWDGSNWVPGDASGGAAGTLYYLDRAAEDIANLNLYNDGSVTPTDGDGGTLTTPDPITASLNTLTPIIGGESYRFSKPAVDRQGEGFSFETDVPLDAPVTAGEPLTVQFRYRTSANYADGDIKMYYYLVGDNELFALNGIDNRGVFGNDLNAETGDRGQFTASINATSATTSIRIIGHIASTNATAYDIDIDEITIGTAATLTAPIVTEWVEYTPTLTSFGPTSSIKAFWRRVGDTMQVAVELIFSGSGSGGNAGISLPSGYNIDTTKRNSSGTGALFGTAGYFDSSVSGGTEYVGLCYAVSSTALGIMPQGLGGSVLQGNAFASGDFARINCFVPIEEFRDATNIVSQTQANFQTGGVHARNSASQSIPNASWTTRTGWTEDRDDLGEFNASTGVFTALKSGWYHFEFSSDFANNATGQRIVALWLNDTQERIAYGEQLPDSTFATVINCSITYYLEKGETVYPKVQQSSGGNLSTNANAATNYFSAIYIPDLSVIGLAGQKDEYLEASLVSGAEATTSAIDTYVDSSTLQLTLTPGTWDLGYNVSTRFNLKSNSGCHINTAIRDGSNNVISNSLAHIRLETVQNVVFPLSAQVRLTVTSNTTYKVSLRCSLAAVLAEARIESEDILGALTDPDGSSYIWARRVK